MFKCDFVCFMYFLVPKLIGKDLNMSMIVIRFKFFGHESPRTTQRVLEEDLKEGSTLPWQVLIKLRPRNDTSPFDQESIDWGCFSIHGCGISSLRNGVSDTNERAAGRRRHTIDGLSTTSVDWTCNLSQVATNLKG